MTLGERLINETRDPFDCSDTAWVTAVEGNAFWPVGEDKKVC